LKALNCGMPRDSFVNGQDLPLVRREVQELSLLFEISQMLDASTDLREVMDSVLKSISNHMGMERGTLTLLDWETGEIYIEAAHGLSPDQQDRGRYRSGEGVTGKVVQTGKPMIVPCISDEPLFLDRTGVRKHLPKKAIAFICVPIKLGNEVIGALSVDRLFLEQVSLEEDVRLLSIIASMIARAVRLRQEMQIEKRRLQQENIRLRKELKGRYGPANIIGHSKAMHEVFEMMAQVSGSDTTVLILGESGTGKELVANAIHCSSPRAGKPFVKVNCAALPETLLESELFGHERGAFTGALTRRIGRFEMANEGSIFLDEIGDFSMATQVRLLRALQEKEFERLGGAKTVKADVRVIAATHRDLEELIRQGKFREDLYYRLNVFPIRMPPLRERKSDILLLADHFVERYAKANKKNIRRISTPAIDMLMSYHWPGNVRELENCIERAVLLSTDDVIRAHQLPPTLQTAEASGTPHRGTLEAAVQTVERELIIDALKSSGGNKAEAARELGISERLMGLRVKKYAIDTRRFRTSK